MNLRTLTIQHPDASTPGANYVPFTRHGDLLYPYGCAVEAEAIFAVR